jgi:hypothetical protein
MNHYEILGISPEASRGEVHRAYLEAARRHHPDRGGSADHMREINEAWAVLGDPYARRAYDRTVVAAPRRAPERHHAGPVGPHGWWDDRMADARAERADLIADLSDDRPLGHPLRPMLTLVPVAMFVLSIVIGSLAMVLDEPALLGFAVLVFFLSLVAVAAVTLVAMRSPSPRAPTGGGS